MPNAASRPSVRAAEKRAERTLAVRGEVITSLMGHPSGREYVQDLLTDAHVFQTNFSPDLSTMYFREGERSFGLRFLDDIMIHCPEQFIQMMRERNARDELERSEPQPDHGDDGSDDTGRDDDYSRDSRKPTGSDVYSNGGTRQ